MEKNDLHPKKIVEKVETSKILTFGVNGGEGRCGECEKMTGMTWLKVFPDKKP